MNGLDLLSKVNEIHATELKIKEIAGNKVEYKRSGAYTLDELLMLNMDYFKHLVLEDGEWVLVFDYTEPYMAEEPVVEEKPKKERKPRAKKVEQPVESVVNKTEVLKEEKTTSVEVPLEKFINPSEPNQDEIENVMDLFA